MDEPLIRILHLSDLAFSKEAAWRQEAERAGLVGCVEALHAEGLSPDVVAITGDVASGGLQEEFDAAAAWLVESLLPAARLSRDRLMLVAGERDIDLAELKHDARTLPQTLLEGGQQVIAEVLADADQRGPLLRRLRRWMRFANTLRGGREALSLPWWTESIEVGGQRIRFAGLCSAIAATAAPDEKGRLLVGEAQVQALLPPRSDDALRVALLHHPTGWLHHSDGGVERLLAQRAELLLRGHDAAPSAQILTRHDRPLVELVAGAASAYLSLVEVRAQEIRLHPFCAVERGWGRDGTRAGRDDGVITLPRGRAEAGGPPRAQPPGPTRRALSLRPPPPPAELPADPYPVLVAYEHPALLGGRQGDLDRLTRALDQERLIWTLYAPSGAGKSSLLRAGLLPSLRGHTGGAPRPVAFDALPAVPGLARRLLEQLVEDPGGVSDIAPLAFAAALAAVRDAASQRPVLVLDQLEEVFDSPALGWLGSMIAASAVAPGGPAARWVLAYREDFHGRVQGWLADLRAHPASEAVLTRHGLPWDLSASETSAAWRLPLLGEVPGAPDRAEAARAAFLDAIQRPLRLTGGEGQPLYPYRIDKADAQRLAGAFAAARLAQPGDPLTPELQVVLDRLIGGRVGSREAPVSLSVPEDASALEGLIGDAIGEHLRRKLAEVCDQGDPAGAAGRRTTALLLMRQLVDDEGRRRFVKKAQLLPDGGEAPADLSTRRALLSGLSRRGVWLVREEQRDGVPHLVLPHDRLAAEIHRILRDPIEIQKYHIKLDIIALWGFVLQREAAWRAGDASAVELSFTRYRELELRHRELPWDETTRAWWRAAEVAREEATRSWARWGGLVALALALLLAGVGVTLDIGALKSTVRSAPPESGEPLRALNTLRTRYRYDGAELADVLGAGGGEGAHMDADKRDAIFGVGPASLTADERREVLGPLVEALARHVEGAEHDESYYGALLAAADVMRSQDAAVADSAQRAVVHAMRAARGAPQALIATDGQWTMPIAGTFLVGCFREVDAWCQEDEGKEPRAVKLSPYRLRKNEETLGQYRRFDHEHLKAEGYPDDWPVFQVNWYEATAYAAWLGAALPTEVQWEVAARGGCDATQPDCDEADYRKTAYFSGPTEQDLNRVGFTVANQSVVFAALKAQRPLVATEALSDQLHPLGLTHVHGNLAEWNADWYEPDRQDGAADPRGPAVPPDPAAARRVLRGGSWGSSALRARSAFRDWVRPSYRNVTVGLRLALPQPVEPGT